MRIPELLFGRLGWVVFAPRVMSSVLSLRLPKTLGWLWYAEGKWRC